MESLRELPSLDRLLRLPEVAALVAAHGHTRVARLLRVELDRLRQGVRAGSMPAGQLGDAVSGASLAARVSACLDEEAARAIRPVFNLTGTVLHTNLGRATLPESAVSAVSRVMRGPVDLEFDLASGRRGAREARVRELVCELAGAEAATVVNNNAAAVLLLLNTLVNRREVPVSRGELVEIGGSFRIPDVMRAAGAKLVEVGTTNRTHPADYLRAIGRRTALLMQVHTSNYAVVGFTAQVDTAQLAAIAREHGLPLAVDLGSGSLLDLAAHGLPPEPTVQDTLAAGADLVTFSGDKLLGGPQAGIIAGRADLIARINRNPLKRALRMDKLGLAALEAVLALYREPELLPQRLPTLRDLTRPVADIEACAQRLLPALQSTLPKHAVEVTALQSQVGSGAQPTATLASAGFVIRPRGGRGGLDALAKRLRGLPQPVIGRIADGALWLDLRCLEAADETVFAEQLHVLRA